MDGLAAQIHPHTGADGCDIIGPQHCHHFFKGIQHLLPGHINLCVFCSYIVGSLPGIFQVNGVLIHPDGKSSHMLTEYPGGNGTYQAGIQPAGEEKSQRSIRVQPLVHAEDQPFPDSFTDGVYRTALVVFSCCQVRITDKFAVRIIVSGREGDDFPAETDKVLCFTCKYHASVRCSSVEQRPDSDGISCCNKFVLPAVIDDHGEFCIEHPEHIRPVFVIQRQDNFTVGIADKGIIFRKFSFQRTKQIQFSVAYAHVAIQMERLHALFVKPHDCQTVKAKNAFTCLFNAAHIRASGFCTVKPDSDFLLAIALRGKAHYGTHGSLLTLR